VLGVALVVAVGALAGPVVLGVALVVAVGALAGPVVLGVALVVAVGALAGPVVLGVALVVAVVALVVWWRVRPASFEATAGRVLLGLWRSAWAYGARWRTAMMLSGLGGRFENDEYLPRVVRVRAGRWADRVVVRIVAGQQPADWARRADALAHAFGARTCQVRETGRPGYLELRVGRRDPSPRSCPPCPSQSRSTWGRCRSAAGRTASPGRCTSRGRTCSSPARPAPARGRCCGP
jgi:S-DNA-T family DNA segregation ATPase FtsK/SpoIIIE